MPYDLLLRNGRVVAGFSRESVDHQAMMLAAAHAGRNAAAAGSGERQ